MRQIDALTSIRFFAALSVVMSHWKFQLPNPVQVFFQHGTASVSLFFILSGFILTYTYSNVFSKAVSFEQYKTFALARFSRIYPTHVFALLAISPVVLPQSSQMGNPDPILFSSWIANLTLIQIYFVDSVYQQFWNAPAWSIACEAVFYAAAPFIIYWSLRTKHPLLWAVAAYALSVGFFSVGAGVIGHWELWSQLPTFEQMDYAVYRQPLARLPEFIAGSCLGTYFLKGHYIGRDYEILAIVASIAWIFVVTTMFPYMLPETLVIRTFYWAVFYIPAFCLLIYALAQKNVFSDLISNRWMVLLGKASFALYMIHWLPTQLMVGPTALGAWLADHLVVTLLATIAASVAVHFWVEVPMQRLLRRTRTRRVTEA